MGKAELMQNEIEKIRKLPKENIEKIKKIIFINCLIEIILTIVFVIINLLHKYLEINLFSNIIKIFNIFLIIADIIVFEIGYRKDNINIWIYATELFLTSISVLVIPYINMYGGISGISGIIYKNFFIIVPIMFLIYYIIKMIVSYIIEVKKYQNSLSDVKEIIKDDEKGYL